MPTNTLWAGLLSQLLMFDETGCGHAARHAIRLLEQLTECDDLDQDVLNLCERASLQLEHRLEAAHVRPA